MINSNVIQHVIGKQLCSFDSDCLIKDQISFVVSHLQLPFFNKNFNKTKLISMRAGFWNRIIFLSTKEYYVHIILKTKKYG
jgi:hypothetical protein